MGPEDGKPGGVLVDPFVPTDTPAIVVDEDLSLSHVNDLCLEPLVDGVFGIDPLANVEVPVFEGELLRVVEVVGALALALLVGSVSEPARVEIGQEVVRVLGHRIVDAVGDESLNVTDGPGQHIEGLSLVEPDLLEVVTCILLEDQSPVSSKHVGFVECPHDFLDQIQILDSIGIWYIWLGHFSRSSQLLSIDSSLPGVVCSLSPIGALTALLLIDLSNKM